GNVKKKVQYETSAEDKFGTSHKGRRHRFSVSHKYVLPVVDKNSEGGQKVEEYKIDVGKLSRSKIKHQVTKWAGKKKWLKEEGKVNVKSGKSDVRKRLGNKEWRKDKKRKDYQVSRKLEDPYPGDAPVDPVKLEKYKRTDTTELKDARYLAAKPDMTLSKNKTDYAVELSARSDFLLPDNSGCIEVEEGEDTADIKQHDIISSVDITSASKYLEEKTISYTPKYRKKGKSSGVRRENRKQGVKNNIIRDDIRDQLKEKRQEKRDKKLANQRGVKSVLDRFKRTVE
ncbi:hypothetical protein LOTGIDRAFT_176451, partial [Lottia gigantea]